MRREPALLGIFSVDTVAMIFGMPSALFPAFGEELGGAPGIVGMLYAAPSAGAFGLARTLPLALLLLAAAGAAHFVSAVLRSTILLQVTPDSMRGRLSGIELAQVAGTPALGNLEAGAVASLAGVRFAIVSGGVACVLGTIALAAALPAFRRYERPRT